MSMSIGTIEKIRRYEIVNKRLEESVIYNHLLEKRSYAIDNNHYADVVRFDESLERLEKMVKESVEKIVGQDLW